MTNWDTGQRYFAEKCKARLSLWQSDQYLEGHRAPEMNKPEEWGFSQPSPSHPPPTCLPQLPLKQECFSTLLLSMDSFPEMAFRFPAESM